MTSFVEKGKKRNEPARSLCPGKGAHEISLKFFHFPDTKTTKPLTRGSQADGLEKQKKKEGLEKRGKIKKKEWGGILRALEIVPFYQFKSVGGLERDLMAARSHYIKRRSARQQG